MAKIKSGSSAAKQSGTDTVIIDFAQVVESEGGGKRYKEGDYVGKIIQAVNDVSSKKGTPNIKLTIQFTEGRYKGKKIVDHLWLSPKALPRLVDLLEILGIKAPKNEVKLNLQKLKGKKIGFTIKDEPNEDGSKIYSRVDWDFLDPDDVMDEDDDEDDLDDDDDEDEDDDDEEEDEDDEDEDDEEEVDLDALDRDELKALIKSEKLDVKVTKKLTDDKLRKQIEAALEGDNDEDEDELDSLDLEEL